MGLPARGPKAAAMRPQADETANVCPPLACCRECVYWVLTIRCLDEHTPDIFQKN